MFRLFTFQNNREIPRFPQKLVVGYKNNTAFFPLLCAILGTSRFSISSPGILDPRDLVFCTFAYRFGTFIHHGVNHHAVYPPWDEPPHSAPEPPHRAPKGLGTTKDMYRVTMRKNMTWETWRSFYRSRCVVSCTLFLVLYFGISIYYVLLS